MFKTFSIFAIVGFLIGLVATPVFAETPGQSDQAKETRVADAEALGAAFAGSEAKTDRSGETVHQVSLDRDDNRNTEYVTADPARARRVLGALLSSMGTLETKPSEGIGLPKTAR